MSAVPSSTFQRIGVVGAGAFGTALAQTLRLAGRDVVLWARDPELARTIHETKRNQSYLPSVALDPGLVATSDDSVLQTVDLVLLAAPAQAIRAVGTRLAAHLPPQAPIVICAKGIEQGSGARLSTVVGDVLPGRAIACLSGPGFAAEIVRGLPTAVTLAASDSTLGGALAAALGHKAFRIYWTDDVVGVELGGAIKNVLAIAAGIVLGRDLGASAHAAIVTRGFAEMRRLGSVLGARPATLSGLSGLGDLLLTATSPQSRNMSLGLALGRGRTLTEILGERRSVTEGVATSAAAVTVARKSAIELPIIEAVHAICTNAVSVETAVDALLSRPFKPED